MKPELLKKFNLDTEKLPKHVAVIMDGNGRWAKKRLLPRNMGHKAGYKALRDTLVNCINFGVEHLSVYVFSTENWKRPESEVSFLMSFFNQLVVEQIPSLQKEGVRMKFYGDIPNLPKSVQSHIKLAEAETAKGQNIQLNMLMNYGSRNEIVNAIKKIVTEKIDPDTITEETVSKHLYTSGIPDPEILIRTSGEVRISNFLLWQIAYSECFFVDTLWPDFDLESLGNILQAYQKRDRRFGGIHIS